MKKYLPLKTGGTATIDILKDGDLADVMALHDEARAAMLADGEGTLQPQGEAYFRNLLSRVTGLMVGARDTGKMVAQMAVIGPMTLREAIALHVITRNDIAYHHASMDDNVIVFKSLAVHPIWRDNELEKHLIAFASWLPASQVVDHIFSQTSVSASRSWEAFVRQKFGIVAAAKDPQDGQPRFILQKPSFGFDFEPHIIADDVDPVSDFSGIVSLTQREGLVGLYENNAALKLSFMRNREEVSLMPVMARVGKQR
ncbi:MAG: hypothetical protein WC464_07900 [Bdellovibrionales bacterium]